MKNYIKLIMDCTLRELEQEKEGVNVMTLVSLLPMHSCDLFDDTRLPFAMGRCLRLHSGTN